MKIYKCVDAASLEQSTREGWTLEQILVCDKSVLQQHTASNAAPPSTQCFYSPTVNVETPVMVREPMFLLVKESEMESREAELTNMLHSANNEHKHTRAAYDLLKRAHDTYKEEADTRTRQLGDACVVQQRLNDANKKLEGHLGKVRDAIGTIEFNKIVNA